MLKILNSFKGDKVIWIVVLILSIFSILAVYSSTCTLAYKYQYGNTEYYLLKHFIILVFGLILMYGTHLIRYTYFSKISKIALIISMLLLLLTIFTGKNLNEASRWLTLPGTSMTFQSSDIAKLALIMYLARTLSKKQDEMKDFKSAFFPVMLPVIAVCGLILPANFSTAAVLFVNCVILMFIGRIKLKYIFSLLGIGVVALSIFLLILFSLPENSQGRLMTWKNRIENFNNPDEENSYQVKQAKIAIATGGVIGKFPGNSTQRNFIPHPYSDFIYAIIIEEYGIVGGIVILLLYLILLFRAVKISTRIPRNFGIFLAMGCCFELVFQAMVNMGVAVNLLPVTGQPLPLISMGGTSLLFTSISVGIILSVSRETVEKDKSEEKEISETDELATA